MNEEDYYCLEFFVNQLKVDRENKENTVDLYEAIFLIASTLHDMENKLDHLLDLVPLKYKKFNPKEGENPFFSIKQMEIPRDKESLNAAKERMENLLKGCVKQDSSEASSTS